MLNTCYEKSYETHSLEVQMLECMCHHPLALVIWYEVFLLTINPLYNLELPSNLKLLLA